MHQYMKSIGFGNIREKKHLTQILKDVEESYTQHQLVTQDETTDLCEFEKEYGEGIGIKVCGDRDIDEQFEYRYYTPYFKGSGVTSYADVSVERRIDREAYVGICEDTKVGINLVFYLQNMMEYLRERQLGGRSIQIIFFSFSYVHLFIYLLYFHQLVLTACLAYAHFPDSKEIPALQFPASSLIRLKSEYSAQ